MLRQKCYITSISDIDYDLDIDIEIFRFDSKELRSSIGFDLDPLLLLGRHLLVALVSVCGASHVALDAFRTLKRDIQTMHIVYGYSCSVYTLYLPIHKIYMYIVL